MNNTGFGASQPAFFACFLKGFVLTESLNLNSLSDVLKNKGLAKLLTVLNQDGEEARIAGGAVRNALMRESISDVDIATTCLPDEVTRRAEARGLKTIPTGVEHGTVTVICDGDTYEVTTLRADIRTDGRRAEVAFGRDWQADAERRDFTMNALYAALDGTIIDLIGGIGDIETRTVRFIGDAETRIREDHLRILRFFRFFAWYGSGRPDAEGLKACARLKESILNLSVERVWSELKKLLGAPDPSRALLWMRQAGVLSIALPESEKWGIDAFHGLVSTGRDLGWKPDQLTRLMAIIPPRLDRVEELAARLKLSTAERERLEQWARAALPSHELDNQPFARDLYRANATGMVDRLKLALADARSKAAQDDNQMMRAAGFLRLLQFAENWKRPAFPVSGADLITAGMTSGPMIGAKLKAMEDQWVASEFKLTKAQLLES
jgi:poly(A) polymerase